MACRNTDHNNPSRGTMDFSRSSMAQGFQNAAAHSGSDVDEVDYPTELAANDLKPKTDHATISSSVYNLTNTILGAGTLCVPFALSKSGFLGGLTAMVIIALVTLYSVSLLLAAVDVAVTKSGGRVKADSYESLGLYTGGAPLCLLAEFTFILGGYGTICSYIIFIGNLLIEVVGVSEHYRWVPMCLVTLCCITPLSLYRRINKLRLVSAAAVIAILFVMVFLLVVVSTVGTACPASAHPYQAFVFSSDSIYTITLLIGAFCCHNTTLPIYAELKQATPRQFQQDGRGSMLLAVIASIAVSFVVYLGCGLAGYHLFCSDTLGDILLNFDHKFLTAHPAVVPWAKAVNVAMALCLTFSAPVAIWPFRSCLLSVLVRWAPPPPQDPAAPSSAGEPSSPALAEPLLPGTPTADTAAIPALLQLSIDSPIPGSPDPSPAPDTPPVELPAVPLTGSDATDVQYVATTISSLLVILVSAVFFPDVETPLSLVGAVAGSNIIFIMPSLFYLLQMEDFAWFKWRSCWKYIGPIMMCAVGVVIGIVGLSLTIYNKFIPHHKRS